jgi:hypothetical protein
MKHPEQSDRRQRACGWQRKTAIILLTCSIKASKIKDSNLIATLISIDE